MTRWQYHSSLTKVTRIGGTESVGWVWGCRGTASSPFQYQERIKSEWQLLVHLRVEVGAGENVKGKYSCMSDLAPLNRTFVR